MHAAADTDDWFRLSWGLLYFHIDPVCVALPYLKLWRTGTGTELSAFYLREKHHDVEEQKNSVFENPESGIFSDTVSPHDLDQRAGDIFLLLLPCFMLDA